MEDNKKEVNEHEAQHTEKENCLCYKCKSVNCRNYVKNERELLHEAFVAGARYGAYSESALKASGTKLDIPNFDTWYMKRK